MTCPDNHCTKCGDEFIRMEDDVNQCADCWELSAYRNTCFTANHKWGECHCKNEVHESQGFEWQGYTIIDPSLSVCSRFFVEPAIYYGSAYINWRKNNVTNNG